MQQPSNTRQVARKRSRLAWLVGETKTQRWLTIGVIAVLSVIAAVYLYVSNQPLLDRRIVSEADFSVYVPDRLPEGYGIDKGATSLSDGTLTYVLEAARGNRRITVTIQPMPHNFDMGQIIDKTSIRSIAVKSGTLYNLSANDSTQYLLDTGDTLVFITSPEKIDIATVNALAGSLVKQN